MTPEEIALDQYANTVRNMIQHENELTNQRVQWMLTTQGLLFAALAFAWKDAVAIVPALCGVGVAVAGATIVNVCFATDAVVKLIKDWGAIKTRYATENKAKQNGQADGKQGIEPGQNKQIDETDYFGPPVVGNDVIPSTKLRYFSPSNFISLAMAIAWICVFCIFWCPAKPADIGTVGRFELETVAGHVYVIDTITGRVSESSVQADSGARDADFKSAKELILPTSETDGSRSAPKMLSE